MAPRRCREPLRKVKTPLPRLFCALSARNYRLFFFGQIISLIGTWMTQTASLWLIYELSSSSFWLGMIGFASQIPIFVLAPFAGVWADRVNRHRLLIGTQIASMLQSLALAALAFTGTISIASLVLLSLVQGLINAFDMPTRQALVVEFVEKREHLGNAIALNSSMFNLARLLGPAIGGFVIARFGAELCYLIDGVSYLAVIAALLAMRYQKRKNRITPKHPLVELKEGFDYAFKVTPIRALILLVGVVSFVGFSYSVLMPIFAHDVFAGDARVLGYLMSASGIGALLGALYLGTRQTLRGLGKVISTGGALMCAGLIGFSLCRWLPLSLLFLGMVGMGGVWLMASSNTVIQSMVEDEKRGRVMSLFTMAFTGTMPLGNLLAGGVAGVLGATITLVLCGLVCGMAALFFFRQIPQLQEAAALHRARVGITPEGTPIFPPEEKDQ